MRVATIVCSMLLGLILLGSIPQVHAQNPIPFQHTVLIIEENRTPDNLFGAGPRHPVCGVTDPFEPGVDVQNGGYDAKSGTMRCLVSTALPVCWDPSHQNSDWTQQAHIYLDQNNLPAAHMDKACYNQVYVPQNCSPPGCPQYTYVQKSDVLPYFDIATNYGFANYMFESPEGPSFEAHQFLLSGTSAPVAPGGQNNWYLDFVAENPTFLDSGCEFNPLANFPSWVDPTGFQPGDQPQMAPCYEHQTLPDRLDDRQKTWRYYAPKPGAIWTAVDAIQHLCWKVPANHNLGDACDTDDWKYNMKFESSVNGAPILTDIRDCKLQNMSWVVPDERWSDHPAFGGIGAGPSYVADIVDAVGNSGCVDNINNQNYTYWQDTAIFIVWDDWGGFYDHVSPFRILRQMQNANECQNPPATWGCGYTDGFRVPLLVVSAYTPAGYVSGALPSPGMQPKYTHDFGSILAFVERNFSLDAIAPPYYADSNTPDAVNGNVPLSDFFQGAYRNFSLVPPTVSFNADYFINYFVNHPNESPLGPDGQDTD